MSALSPGFEADLLAASQGLEVPGMGEQRVLSPVAVERLAAAAGLPLWKVDALALQVGVTPLRYLRNRSQLGVEGQIRLLEAEVALVGAGPVILRALDLLAAQGVGRFRVLQPAGSAKEGPAKAVRNRNASCEVESRPFDVAAGNPAAALRGADAVGACLEDSGSEQLLQFACRMARLPVVLVGVAGSCGQATTVLPGDPGTALVYRPSHAHLDARRAGEAVDRRAALMVGTWLSEQLVRLLTGEGELLRGRLLYADMRASVMTEYPL